MWEIEWCLASNSITSTTNMFRLAARSSTRARASFFNYKSSFAASALRFYSANGLSTEEITRRITEANSHLIKDPKSITVDTNLAKDLGLDSLDSTEFLVNIENEFDFQVSDEDSEKVKTIGQIVELISANPDAN